MRTILTHRHTDTHTHTRRNGQADGYKRNLPDLRKNHELAYNVIFQIIHDASLPFMHIQNSLNDYTCSILKFYVSDVPIDYFITFRKWTLISFKQNLSSTLTSKQPNDSNIHLQLLSDCSYVSIDT